MIQPSTECLAARLQSGAGLYLATTKMQRVEGFRRLPKVPDAEVCVLRALQDALNRGSTANLALMLRGREPRLQSLRGRY